MECEIKSGKTNKKPRFPRREKRHSCTMKKKTTKAKKNTTPKAVKAPEVAPTAKGTEADGVNPLTKEAFKWMVNKDSIPGAFPPVLYCGPSTLLLISQALGRQIELDEAKRLVQADGEKQICAITGKEFRPVAYVPFCPKGLKSQIEAGATLLEARLPFGGQYYFIKGEPKPVSGSVFHYDERTDSYDFANSSPLVILAREFAKKKLGMKWGVPLGQIDQVLGRKKERNKNQEVARELVEKFLRAGRDKRFSHGKRLVPVGEAFDEAKREGKKKRRHRSENDGE